MTYSVISAERYLSGSAVKYGRTYPSLDLYYMYSELYYFLNILYF